jgi:hypothetical protein
LLLLLLAVVVVDAAISRRNERINIFGTSR